MRVFILLMGIFLSFFVKAQNVPNYVPSNGLIGWWPFDGNANDESGNGNDGTVNGATLTTDRFGNANSAYDFDGVDDFIEMSDISSVENVNSMTWSAWIECRSNPFDSFSNRIISKELEGQDNDRMVLIINSNSNAQKINLILNGTTNSSAISSNPIVFDSLYFVTVVYDYNNTLNTNRIKIYVNANLIAQTVNGTVPSSTPNNPYNLKFGRHDNPATSWDGTIDDIGIWNRALNECEIQDLYNAQLNTPTVDLGPDQSICQGDSVLLDAGAGYNYYSWNTGETTQTIYAAQSGDYAATVGDSVGVNNNYSLSFDGVDDYIDFGNSVYFDFSNSPLTVMCWVKIDTTSHIDGIISKNESNNYGWWLSTVSSSPIWSNPNSFQFGGAASNSNYFGAHAGITFNNWVNISATHINGEQKIYVNGQLIDQDSHQYNLYNSTTSLLVGKKIGDTHFDGLIDEVQIWSSALTQSEIQSYMNCPPVGNENGLVGYWDFEEGSGSNTADQTANGNDGTINGASWSTDVPNQVCLGCSATDSVYVDLHNVEIQPNDPTICFGDSVELGLGYQFSYTPGSTIPGLTYGGFFNGSHYYVTTNNMEWTTGDTLANFYGGYLCVINSQTELQFIVDSLGHLFTPASQTNGAQSGAWIGMLNGQWLNSQNGISNYCVHYDNNGVYGMINLSDIISMGGTSDPCIGDEDASWFDVVSIIEIEGFNSILWSNGDTTPSITVAPTTNTSYSVEVDNGISVCTDTVLVTVSNPQVDLGDTLSFCNQDSVLLDAGAGYNYYSWNTGDTTQTIYASQSGDYAATVGDSTPLVNDYSMSFDGVDDYTQLSSNTNFGNNSFTVSIYCSLDNFGENEYESYSYILGVPIKGIYNEQGFKIQTTSQNSIYGADGFAIHVGDINGLFYELTYSNNIQLNNWYNITFVLDRNNNQFLFYLDGQLVNSLSISPSFGNIDLGIPISIGIQSEDLYHNLDGKTDNLHIWNNALTQKEIQTYMNCPPIGNESELVGYWNFEEGSGSTTADQTANGNDGTISGATWSTDVPNQVCLGCTATDSVYVDLHNVEIQPNDPTICFGDSVELNVDSGLNNLSSIEFDGADDYLSLTNSNNMNLVNQSNLTLSAWVNPKSISAQSGIITSMSDILGVANSSGHAQYSLKLINGKIYFLSGHSSYGFEPNGPTVGNTSLNLNQWQHIAVTYDGSFLKFYLNGIEDFQEFIPNQTFPTSSGIFEIARYGPMNANSFHYFDGFIDEPCIWNVALTEAEIQQFMNCPPTGNEAGLVGYWNFEEGTGTSTADQTSNGNNGTINGASWSTDVPVTCSSTSSVLWSTAATTSSITVAPTTTTSYSVEVDNGISVCTDTVLVTVSNPQVDLGDTLSFCNQDSVLLDAGAGYNYYSWNTGDTTQTIYATQSGDYAATVGDSVGVDNDYSLSFDGVDDYVSSNLTNFNNIDDFSFCFWLKTNSQFYSRLINKDCNNCPEGEWKIDLETNGSVVFEIEPGGGTASSSLSSITAVNNNNYYFISCTRNNLTGETKLFVNGILENSSTSNSNIYSITNTFPLYIGGINSGGNYFSGSMDQISIWNTALSQQEILTYMNCAPSGNETGLVGYWNFEEGTGTAAIDQTANGNNGTINGASWSSDVPGQVCLGCTATDSVYLQELALPTVDAGADQSVCDGNQVTLSATGAVSYLWDNGVSDGVPFNPTATGTYTVTGTDANGCVAEDSTLITVNPIPTVDAGVDQTVCDSSQVILSASGAVSYTWDNGVTDGAAFNPTITATYTVTGTDGNGCEGFDSVVVNVNSLPAVDAGADLVICLGDSISLSGSGASSYTWDNGVADGISFSPTSTISYNVTGTDVNGCQGIDSITVTVNALPTVDAVADQSVCDGDQVTLSATGAVSYSWDNGVSDGVPFNPSASGTYTVTGTDANGCVAEDSTIVTVNPLPSVFAGNDQQVCSEDSVLLSGAGAITYLWDNGVVDGVYFVATSTLIYTLTGTDSFGCSNVDYVTVNVNSLPTVDAGTDQTICEGSQVTLTGSGAVSYTWNNAVVDNQPFTPSQTATYVVTGTDANGCSSSDSVVVSVVTNLVVYAGEDTTICEGQGLILSGSGAVNYSWDNGVTDGVFFIPSATSSYILTGTDGSNCEDKDTITVTLSPLPNLTGIVVDVNQGQDGSIDLAVSGGTPPYLYDWDNDGVGDFDDPQDLTSLSSGTYYVIVLDDFGCSETLMLIVEEDLQLFISTLLTPNGDGFNDYWGVTGLQAYPEAKVQVLNRWGQVLYSSTGYGTPWDGTFEGNRLPASDYYYIIDLGSDNVFTGTITIKY